MPTQLEQQIMELESYNADLIRDNNQLRNELSDQYSHNLKIEIEYDEKIKSLEYELFLEKRKESKHKFYWFTGKTRPPAHVVYSNKETQFFGFSEVPQYKFIEHHDLQFITNCSLDDLIEQFR